MTGQQILLLVASSVGAGVMNAMAGGGTILTFPALLFAGESAITANATSTVALWTVAVRGRRKDIPSVPPPGGMAVAELFSLSRKRSWRPSGP